MTADLHNHVLPADPTAWDYTVNAFWYVFYTSGGPWLVVGLLLATILTLLLFWLRRRKVSRQSR